MKRIASILSALLISTLIVWMSVGVALWQCDHTGMTVQVLAGEQQMDANCCAGAAQTTENSCCAEHSVNHSRFSVPPCMHVQVLQLSPSTVAPTGKQAFAQAPSLILFCILWAPVVLPVCARKTTRRVPTAWHSPPRLRLCKLRVLLI